MTALDISDVKLTVDGCSTTRLSVRNKYQETVFLTVVTEVAAVSVCLDSPGYSGQFGERQFYLGLGIILLGGWLQVDSFYRGWGRSPPLVIASSNYPAESCM